jgi:hypothetical protein
METALTQTLAASSTRSSWSRIDDIFARNRQRRARTLAWTIVAMAIFGLLFAV